MLDVDREVVVAGDVLVLTSEYFIIPPSPPVLCVNTWAHDRWWRRLSRRALTVSQASLAGELMPVKEKPTTWPLPTPPEFTFDMLDNENICLAGTSVATVHGHLDRQRDPTWLPSQRT